MTLVHNALARRTPLPISNLEDVIESPIRYAVMEELETPSPISELPMDIALAIADYGDLMDMTSLACTCRSMYMFLRPTLHQRRGALRGRSHDRLAALHHMWREWPLPDCILCTVCCAFHPRDSEDAPAKGVFPCWFTGCIGSKTRNSFDRYYSLREHHIAYVMRYRWRVCSSDFPFSALKRDEIITHTARLQRPLSMVCKPHCDNLIKFQAEPIITDGGIGRPKSFLLKTIRTYALEQPRSDFASKIPSIRLCPHLFHQQYQVSKCGYHSPLTDNLHFMLEHSRGLKFGYCRLCPTDYSVRKWEDGLELVVVQDLGNGDPGDVRWKVQQERNMSSRHYCLRDTKGVIWKLAFGGEKQPTFAWKF